MGLGHDCEGVLDQAVESMGVTFIADKKSINENAQSFEFEILCKFILRRRFSPIIHYESYQPLCSVAMRHPIPEMFSPRRNPVVRLLGL